MEHEVAGHFAVPITSIKLTTKENERLKDLFYNKVRNKKWKYKGYNVSGKHTHYNRIFDEFKEIKDISNKVNKMSNFVYQEVMNYESELFVTENWFNYAKQGARQHFHAHANSVLSGTIYIDHGTDHIIFKNPYHEPDIRPLTINHIEDNHNPDKKNKYGYIFHAPEIEMEVSDGTILFWPSYLRHGYYETQRDARLTLSFNCFPKKFNSLYSTSTY